MPTVSGFARGSGSVLTVAAAVLVMVLSWAVAGPWTGKPRRNAAIAVDVCLSMIASLRCVFRRRWTQSYTKPQGASSTCLQAAGRSAMVSGARGFGGSFGGGGCRTESLNQ